MIAKLRAVTSRYGFHLAAAAGVILLSSAAKLHAAGSLGLPDALAALVALVGFAFLLVAFDASK